MDELHAIGEVTHESEGANTLREPRDLAKVHHEAVRFAELVQTPALCLKVLDELHFVLCGDERLQKLQEIQPQSFQVVPVGQEGAGSVRLIDRLNGRIDYLTSRSRFDGVADFRSILVLLAQSDGQIFGPVKIHHRHFDGRLGARFCLQGSQVHSGGLGFGLKLILKRGHVQSLQEHRKTHRMHVLKKTTFFTSGHFFKIH